MKPTPEELVAGVRELLRRYVGPELTSKEALHHFKLVMATLKNERWNEAGFDLLKENVALTRIADDCEAWLGAADQKDAEVKQWRSALGVRGATPLSFAEANAANAALRGLLSDFLSFVATRPWPADAGQFQRKLARDFLAVRVA